MRIYGVPLQAWNLDFFKLCVYDCGQLLKVDDSTLEKIRFDYARVLVSTSSLDLINSDAKVLVDGVLFYFKIVEEGGFSLGEDACLSDDDVSKEDDDMGDDRNHEECNANDDVENLVHHLSEEWRKEQQDSQAFHASPVKETSLLEEAPTEAVVKEVLGSAAVPFMPQKTNEVVIEHQAANNISNGGDAKVSNTKSQPLSGVKRKV